MEPAFDRVYDASAFIYGGGVAIFHLASSRVVVCHHPRESHWFLPKGRRDAGEESQEAAEREGFEESGYRNRILPLPVNHSQPKPHNPAEARTKFSRYVREPILTYLTPFGWKRPYSSVQYLVAWYIAETLPPELQEKTQKATAEKATVDNPNPYVTPERYPQQLKLRDRIAQDPENYVPIKIPFTGVDSDELTYESHLLPVDEALGHLEGSVHAHIVKTGWELIQKRLKEEESFES